MNNYKMDFNKNKMKINPLTYIKHTAFILCKIDYISSI